MSAGLSGHDRTTAPFPGPAWYGPESVPDGPSRSRGNGGSVTDVRGNPWEHDPGPPSSSGWAELFAQTPNYRGLGRAVLSREAFRWQHGPMFFRGRLDGSAKVLVVGRRVPRTSRSRTV